MNVLQILELLMDKFYYALGGIKAVGYEAISNIVKERIKMENLNQLMIL